MSRAPRRRLDAPRYTFGREKPLPRGRETVEEFLARGGEITRLPASGTPEVARTLAEYEARRVKRKWSGSGSYG